MFDFDLSLRQRLEQFLALRLYLPRCWLED
jgi:hypothetical protein